MFGYRGLGCLAEAKCANVTKVIPESLILTARTTVKSLRRFMLFCERMGKTEDIQSHPPF